jgi:hypothetical protein
MDQTDGMSAAGESGADTWGFYAPIVTISLVR